MKKITSSKISHTVSALCIRANTHLRSDVLSALKKALRGENNLKAKKILKQLIDNARISRSENIALCQDTGLPIVFVDIGRGLDLSGIDIVGAVGSGVEQGYRQGRLRDSIVSDPLYRQGSLSPIPCITYIHFGRHKGLRLTLLPKGFGCENKTRLKMFNPTAAPGEIEDFVVSVVREAGPDACPPYILGIGIGGTSDYAAGLAKEALLRPISKSSRIKSVAAMEDRLLKKVNRLNIGPMGLGGKTTALGVNILTYPTHIAGLPVCVNVSCHALRSASDLLK